MTDSSFSQTVLVIGAGPAGIYASKQLMDAGIQVALLNRDIKPGGLAEYGIYPNKYKMKSGLRKQFKRIFDYPNLTYLGNVTVGQDITLDELRQMGFGAILVTVGAQGTKWLGLPGEDLKGVYHAKDLVYYYNKLPPFSQQTFPVGNHMIIVGVGNVMLDIAHWAIRDLGIEQVTAVARRGPAEVKFTKKEMQNVGNNLDLPALDAEIERCRERMEKVGQDADSAKEFITSGLKRALDPVSDTRFGFRFFSSPKQMIGDGTGQLVGVEVDDTHLIDVDGVTKARSVGTSCVMPADTMVFAIGDKVDESFGLPVEWSEYVKSPTPQFPIDGESYEAFDPEQNAPLQGVFVAGWSRSASDGVGWHSP